MMLHHGRRAARSIFSQRRRGISSATIDRSAVLSLAVELVNVESVTGNEGPMADALEEWLTSNGRRWDVKRQPLVEGSDRHNLLATLPGCRAKREAGPRLLFNTHIDVVPPFFPASTDDEYLYGRGACDTKGLIAAMLFAVQGMVDTGAVASDDVGFLFTVDEEEDHAGMIKANELGLNPEFLITGEPTEGKMAARQKGLVTFRLEKHGKPAHSGYPHLGDDALGPMLDVLQDLRAETWPSDVHLGETTMNIGVLRAGAAANIVPEHAFAEVLFRCTGEYREIQERVERIVADRVECRVAAANDPLELSTMEGFETMIAAFNTDIAHLKFDGQAFLLGAGAITDAHTAEEKINIDDMVNLVTSYQVIAQSLLSSAGPYPKIAGHKEKMH